MIEKTVKEHTEIRKTESGERYYITITESGERPATKEEIERFKYKCFMFESFINVNKEKVTLDEITDGQTLNVDVTYEMLKNIEINYKSQKKEMEEKDRKIEEQAKELERLKAEKPYDVIGSTQLTNSIKTLLSFSGTDRNIRGNKNLKVTTNKDLTGKTEINFKSRNTDTTITIKDYETIATKQDKNTVKVFNYLLQISNETNYNPEIKFNLTDLVDLGIYKSIPTARQGFINCMDKLLKFEIEGTIKKGKTEIRSKKGYLFYDRDIKENYCTVMRNETINIELIAQYLTLLPKWSYSLKTDKACNLVDYIFYRARQEIDNIKENGYFNMSFESINTRLGQPKPTETVKHSQYIITPILEAITEIENTQNEKRHTDIRLTPIYTEGKVTDFLDGYLKVELMDVSKTYFIEQAIKKEDETKKAISKAEKIRTKNEPKNTL